MCDVGNGLGQNIAIFASDKRKHMQFLAVIAPDSVGIAAQLGGTVSEVGERFGFNIQLFVSQLIAFFIVSAILYKWAIKPLQGVLAERSEKIAESLASAERMKQELAKAEEERQRVLAEAGRQANLIIEEAKRAAARMTELEIQKATTAAQDIAVKTQQASEAELVRLRAELRKEVGRLIVQTTSKVTGKVLTAEDQKRLAEETNRELTLTA
jgi:F-type H+-transporting ATPase subunit b